MPALKELPGTMRGFTQLHDMSFAHEGPQPLEVSETVAGLDSREWNSLLPKGRAESFWEID
jgi:hypothetical protein